jgi:fucose permease
VQLLTICLFYIIGDISYNVNGVLQVQVIKQFSVDNQKYNQLNAYYSIPNVITPLIAGLLIDRLGIRM